MTDRKPTAPTAPKPPAPKPPAPHGDPPTRPPAQSEPDPPAGDEDRPRATGPQRVQAIHDGYYGEKYRRRGDVFTLAAGDPFGKWMELVDPDTPERITSHNEALQQHRTDTMEQRARERSATGGLTVPEDNPEGSPDPIGAREG